MRTVPKPYPQEFREDVIRVARNREPGVHLKQIAADFGISESCLNDWLAKADSEGGIRLGDPAQSASERELKMRIRLLEQENEVLRRAAAYLSQANLPGK